MLRQLINPVLVKLWEYDLALTAKEYIRPLKHFVFGRGDIYYVLDVVARAREGWGDVKVVLDIGAAIGDKTRTFLRTFPLARVYCFEPQSVARERLRRRVSRWKNRVEILPFGLSNENCGATLKVYSHRDASSIFPIPYFLQEQGKREIGTEAISLRRLDDCLPELGVGRIDFMKVDIEGAERELLEGARTTLDMTDNVYVEIEPLRNGLHSRRHIEVFQILHEAGFTLIGQYGDFWFSKDAAVLRTYFGDEQDPRLD